MCLGGVPLVRWQAVISKISASVHRDILGKFSVRSARSGTSAPSYPLWHGVMGFNFLCTHSRRWNIAARPATLKLKFTPNQPCARVIRMRSSDERPFHRAFASACCLCLYRKNPRQLSTESGVRVSRTNAGGAAERTGVRREDRLVSVG